MQFTLDTSRLITPANYVFLSNRIPCCCGLHSLQPIIMLPATPSGHTVPDLRLIHNAYICRRTVLLLHQWDHSVGIVMLINSLFAFLTEISK